MLRSRVDLELRTRELVGGFVQSALVLTVQPLLPVGENFKLRVLPTRA